MPTRIQINIDAMKAMNDPNVKPKMTKVRNRLTEFFAPFSWTTLTVSGSAFFGWFFAHTFRTQSVHSAFCNRNISVLSNQSQMFSLYKYFIHDRFIKISGSYM